MSVVHVASSVFLLAIAEISQQVRLQAVQGHQCLRQARSASVLRIVSMVEHLYFLNLCLIDGKEEGAVSCPTEADTVSYTMVVHR